ncbi:MAG TPA: hypothetical protein VME40_16590, partial [Caulobacteraceae bacterium]|nr:hypothetical protein [Caulobacteraceae bacterium]
AVDKLARGLGWAAIGTAAALAGASLAAGAACAAEPNAASPPAPSPVAIGHCLWEGLPKATRDAVAASGPTADDVYHAMNAMNPSLMDVARAQCPSPATPEDAQKVTDAWVALALQAWAQTELYRQDKIAPETLEDAWRRFTPAERRQFELDEDKPPAAERANVASMSKALGVTAPADVDLVAFWVLCQLHLAALGG